MSRIYWGHRSFHQSETRCAGSYIVPPQEENYSFMERFCHKVLDAVFERLNAMRADKFTWELEYDPEYKRLYKAMKYYMDRMKYFALKRYKEEGLIQPLRSQV